MVIFLVFLIAGGCVYLACVITLARALRNVRPGLSSKKPFVSVVIAARNERPVIGVCLASIIDQTYPIDNYEIIVADDRSVDGTADVLERFQAVWYHIRVIRIETVPEGVSPKKYALSRAIHEAHGDIILQTDADCIIPRGWISGMVRGFEPGVGMVVGIAPYLPRFGFLNSFIRHEYLWNAALSAGSIALGHGTHASSRNIAFKREVFERLDGYGSTRNILSGDDTLFLQRMRRLTDYRAVTMPETATHVYTEAPKGFRAFLRQRIRHMSTGRYFDPVLIAVGSTVYGFHMLLTVLFIWAVYSVRALTVFGIIFLCKIAVDTWAARRTRKALGLHVQTGAFIVNELYLTVYMAIMPLLGFLVPVKWKEK